MGEGRPSSVGVSYCYLCAWPMLAAPRLSLANILPFRLSPTSLFLVPGRLHPSLAQTLPGQ